MHEFSMTAQIVDTVVKEAKKHNAKRVSAVHLMIGKLTFLSLEQVKFAYGLLVKNTILENSELHIEEKEGFVKCGKCGYTGDLKFEDDPMYHFRSPIFNCPKCGGMVSIVGGKECTIKSIKLLA